MYKAIILNYIYSFSFIISFLNAQIYDFSDYPDSLETFNTANFRVYISENIDTIKGIYMYMHGFGGDSRLIVEDTTMQTLSESISFALMGVQLDNMHMDSGIGNSLIEAKIYFSEQSNHSELIYSPLFFDGYSWGGQWSYHYSQWRPQDVIAFITMKGGYHDTAYCENAINVPAYMFIGENDADYRIENLTNVFLKHRPDSAIWTLAMEPNAGHSRISDRNLLNPFLFDMIDKRLPEYFNLNEPVELNSIPPNSGWLGNRDTFDIFNSECYESNIDSLSWISNVVNAQNWQSFVSDSTVNTINDCYLGDLDFDENLSILDIFLLLDFILSHTYQSNGDMNYDQVLNIEDILILIQLILQR